MKKNIFNRKGSLVVGAQTELLKLIPFPFVRLCTWKTSYCLEIVNTFPSLLSRVKKNNVEKFR